jgi:hypothetical protein
MKVTRLAATLMLVSFAVTVANPPVLAAETKREEATDWLRLKWIGSSDKPFPTIWVVTQQPTKYPEAFDAWVVVSGPDFDALTALTQRVDCSLTRIDFDMLEVARASSTVGLAQKCFLSVSAACRYIDDIRVLSRQRALIDLDGSTHILARRLGCASRHTSVDHGHRLAALDAVSGKGSHFAVLQLGNSQLTFDFHIAGMR